MKYKLRWYQWLAVPLMYLHWRMEKSVDTEDKIKDTFDLVLKGMEYHEHNYVKYKRIHHTDVWMCDHPGCYMVSLDYESSEHKKTPN